MGPPRGSTSAGPLAGALAAIGQRIEGAAMSFREVRVFEVREVLRLWLGGEGLRSVERLAGIDRKTVRRYVEAAVEAGLDATAGKTS